MQSKLLEIMFNNRLPLLILLWCGWSSIVTGTIDIKCNHDRWICFVDDAINVNDDDKVKILSSPNADAVNHFELRVASHLKEIPLDIFKTFELLQTLVLTNAHIETISNNETFVNAKQLKTLDLKTNQIRIIPAGVFLHASNLEYIDLSENKIETIEDYAFKALPNIREIILNDNRIKVLTQLAFNDAFSLTTLRINSNELELIKNDALLLPNLITIDLSRNQLTTLPNNLSALLPSVEFLDLSQNNITHIGITLFNSSKLYSLNLSRNPLQDLNLTSFATLKSLHELSLNGTGIKLPDEIPNWSEADKNNTLHTLNLGDNNITTADILKHIAVYRNLSIVHLESNNLTHFHDVHKIKNILPNIKIIDILFNPICDWLQDFIDILHRNDFVIIYDKTNCILDDDK